MARSASQGRVGWGFVRRVGSLLQRAGLVDMSTLEELPGTPYSRYSVPVEYMPSRGYRPRWGANGRPPIGWMMDQFHPHRGAFAEMMAEMSEVSALFSDIPEQHIPDQLPTPAWYGVPYAPFDAVALCTMIRKHKPKLFLEIGSGISTC